MAINKGIQKIYSEVHGTYEMVNHVLTLGQDFSWRKKAARAASAKGAGKYLDVCSGTGEMAIDLCRFAPSGAKVVASDFSAPMLKLAAQKRNGHPLSFSLSDSRQLPFKDNTFDAITISFATRNINPSRDGLIGFLREFRRVLKPGGVFVNLETSQPRSRLVRWTYHLYVRLFVTPVGFLISGSRVGYEFLSHTIPRFYHADEFAAIIKEAGFSTVDVTSFFFDAVAIHKGVK